jgi:hypothetical protein
MKLVISLMYLGFVFLGISQLAEANVTSPHSLKELQAMSARLTPVKITGNLKSLSPGDKKALEKIIAAAKLLDPIYLNQVWSGNPELKKNLSSDKTALGLAVYHLFKQNVGPWSRLDNDAPFVNGVPKEKPDGAGFYPDDMTKDEFNAWANDLSEKEKAKATGFFTTIRRDSKGKLKAVAYSEEYREWLEPAAALLKEAAELTTNSTLKRFLTTRADAFLSDNYYESDVAWMDLDAPIDLTIGPYETYEDEIFNYKAAFEAFVTLRDDVETQKLTKFSGYLQEIENNLPIDPKHKNPKLGAMSPIRVVDQVFASGEARRGVMTAAFNLPNDEKVVAEKGSKRVMLKNVQEAKFNKVLTPISKKVLRKTEVSSLAFDSFFTHILMHELMHGLGPHNIKVEGKETTVRKELKELYSAMEEAKADISGLFALQYLIDKGVIEKSMEKTLYTTFLASAFRSVRFGINEAHGKGVALQFNYLTDKGAIVYDPKTETFHAEPAKFKEAAKALTGDIMTVQAEGSYSKAKAMLEKYGVLRPEMAKALGKMKSIPVDLEPSYPLEETTSLSE